MQTSINGDLGRDGDWLCHVSAEEVSTLPSAHTRSRQEHGKPRLVGLRGYPTRRLMERPASHNSAPSAPGSSTPRSASAVMIPTNTDHATLSLQSFVQRLRGYHTFQPLFTTNRVYPFLLEGSRAIGNSARALAYVDRMLDASESQLLRHHCDDEFSQMVAGTLATSAVDPMSGRSDGPPSYCADVRTGAAQRALARPVAIVDSAAAKASADTTSTAEEGDADLELVAAVGETQHVLHSRQRDSDGGLTTKWKPEKSTVSNTQVATSGTGRIKGTNTSAHADADAELNEQQRVWEISGLERHRIQRTRYLENLHLEMDVLERQTLAAPHNSSTHALRAHEGHPSSTCEAPPDELTPTSATERDRLNAVAAAREEAAKREAQRRAWEAFHASQSAAPQAPMPFRGEPGHMMAASSATAAGSSLDTPIYTESRSVLGAARGGDGAHQALTTAASTLGVKDSDSDEIHNWLHGNWSHRTHRHENAALTIQRAYRLFRAKRTAYRRACARELAFQEALRAEMTVRRRWLHAERLIEHDTTDVDATASRMRFVADRLSARAALRRRAREQAQSAEAELRQYAAIAIQRVFRGHLGRIEARCLRSPKYRQQREAMRLDYAAALIQRRWRRCRPVLLAARRTRSALYIQHWYRGCVARRALSRLRSAKRHREEAALQRYSVAILERFFRACLERKHAFYHAHKPYVDLIQRCGRGSLVRAHVMRSLWTAHFKPAVSFIETRRCHVRAVRGAQAVVHERRQARSAQYNQWRMTDAAITIQRAWRRHACSRSASNTTTFDEL